MVCCQNCFVPFLFPVWASGLTASSVWQSLEGRNWTNWTNWTNWMNLCMTFCQPIILLEEVNLDWRNRYRMFQNWMRSSKEILQIDANRWLNRVLSGSFCGSEIFKEMPSMNISWAGYMQMGHWNFCVERLDFSICYAANSFHQKRQQLRKNTKAYGKSIPEGCSCFGEDFFLVKSMQIADWTTLSIPFGSSKTTPWWCSFWIFFCGAEIFKDMPSMNISWAGYILMGHWNFCVERPDWKSMQPALFIDKCECLQNFKKHKGIRKISENQSLKVLHVLARISFWWCQDQTQIIATGSEHSLAFWSFRFVPI